MPMTVDQLTAEALNLPAEARAELAERLAVSLDTAELTEIDRRWATEARRRAEELTSGQVQGIPGEQVLAEARQILGE